MVGLNDNSHRATDRRTWLIALVAISMVMVVPQTSDNAEAATWGTEYIVGSGSILDQHSMAVDGDMIFVTYTVVFHAEHYTALRWYDGSAWSGMIRVDTGSTNQQSPVVAAADGVAHFAWVDHEDGDADVKYRSFDGTDWSSVFQVSGAMGRLNSNNPAIAVDGDDVHIVWEEWLATDKDIFYRGLVDGRWGSIGEVSSDAAFAYQVEPDVAARDGLVHVVWQDPGGGDDDIIYRMNDGSGWQTPVEISVDIRGEAQSRPAVATDGNQVHVAYEQQDTVGKRIHMRTYKDAWTTPVMVSPVAMGPNQYEADITAEDGHVAIVFRQSLGSHEVHFRHFDGTAWEAVETISTDQGSDVYSQPQVCLLDGTAHALFFHAYSTSKTLKYRSAALDQTTPMATAGPVSPYWMDRLRVSIPWTATDDYSIVGVSLHYRFSTDKVNWDQWTLATTISNLWGPDLSGLMSFAPAEGEGFYEFQAVATDRGGHYERILNAEARGAVDVSAPTGRVTINDGDPYTDNATVTLDLTYTDKMTDLNNTLGKPGYSVHLSNDAVTWSDWSFGLPSIEWDLEAGEGERTVYCQVMDEAGLVSAVFNDTIVMDATAPTGSITINGGAEWTTELRVTLTLTFEDATSGVTGVRFGDEAVGGDEPWDNPVETKEWTLPEGDRASATVVYQVRDAAGHMSEVYSASIGLDTAPPTGSIVINGGDAATYISDASLSLTTEDDTSGVVEMRVSNEAIGGDEPWENPASTLDWDLGDTGGRVTVYYQVRDAAGLVSEVYSDDILLDMDKPTGTIALASGAMVTNTATVTLALTYADATSNVVGIRVQEEAVGGDEPWDNPLESWEITLSAGEGAKTVHYQVLDEADQASQVYTLTITLDSTNPYVDETDPDDGEKAVKVASPLVVRFTEPMDPSSVEDATRLYWVDKDGTSHDIILSFTWSPDGRTATLAPSSALGEGTEHFLEVGTEAMDAAGNALFPAIAYSFTTEGDAGGNGGNGDGDGDDGGNLLLIMVAVMVVAMAAIMGMMFYMKRR